MKTTLLLLSAFTLVFVLTTITFAQGVPIPMLPGAPSQAPIDGGLSLLAAAGGAYAWKKLKERKNEEEIDI